MMPGFEFQLTGYVIAVIAVGYLVQCIKRLPGAAAFFRKIWGRRLLLLLPMVLGMGCAFVLYKFGLVKEPWITGIAIAGLSSVGYDWYQSRFKAQSYQGTPYMGGMTGLPLMPNPPAPTQVPAQVQPPAPPPTPTGDAK